MQSAQGEPARGNEAARVAQMFRTMVDIMMLRIERDHTDDQIELHRAALDVVADVAGYRESIATLESQRALETKELLELQAEVESNRHLMEWHKKQPPYLDRLPALNVQMICGQLGYAHCLAFANSTRKFAQLTAGAFVGAFNKPLFPRQ
jgi:hypothetical protein